MPRSIQRNRPVAPWVDARPVSLEELEQRIYDAGRKAVERQRESPPFTPAQLALIDEFRASLTATPVPVSIFDDDLTPSDE